MSLGSGYSETNNGFRYLIAHALISPIDSPHAPHGQASVNQGVAIIVGERGGGGGGGRGGGGDATEKIPEIDVEV